MKKIILIILIAVRSSLIFGQNELSDRQRIEILEAKENIETLGEFKRKVGFDSIKVKFK